MKLKAAVACALVAPEEMPKSQPLNVEAYPPPLTFGSPAIPMAVEACGQYGKLTCLVQLPAKKFAPTAMPNVPFLKSADGMFGALFRLNNCDVGAPRPLENIVWKKLNVCKSPGLETTILPEDVWIVGVLEPAN